MPRGRILDLRWMRLILSPERRQRLEDRFRRHGMKFLLLARVLPYWHVNPKVIANAWLKFRLDFWRCLLTLLPATFLWGASFPLACAAAARPGEDSGRVAGGIYAANTLGGIVGALAVSLVLIPWIGSQQSQRVLLIAAGLGGLLILVPILKRSAMGIV